jgi:hypothetical protein
MDSWYCLTICFLLYGFLVLMRQGIALEAQRVGFPFAEIRFVLVGARAMLDRRTIPINVP